IIRSGIAFQRKVEDKPCDPPGNGTAKIADRVHAAGHDGRIALADVLATSPGGRHGEVVEESGQRYGEEKCEGVRREEAGEVTQSAQAVSNYAENTSPPFAIPGTANEPIGQPTAKQAGDGSHPERAAFVERPGKTLGVNAMLLLEV